MSFNTNSHLPSLSCKSIITSVTDVCPKTCAVQSLTSTLSVGELVWRVIFANSITACKDSKAMFVSYKEEQNGVKNDDNHMIMLFCCLYNFSHNARKNFVCFVENNIIQVRSQALFMSGMWKISCLNS